MVKNVYKKSLNSREAADRVVYELFENWRIK